jgi:diacylglycerol kinase (ATP)
MPICVIFNPTARGDKARRFRQTLERIVADCILKPTLAPGGARGLAADAVREGCDTVVAAGGDGTVNEVLNGIGDQPDGFERARLGILPLGTVNVFAKELGLPEDVGRAWDIIRAGRERSIDLPQAEFSSGSGVQQRYFAQLAGAGLDAKAIELVDWGLKKRIGPLAYVVAGLRAMQGPQSPITVAAGTRTATGELVLIGNGRYYGGKFVLFPRADLRDGVLDVTVFARVRWQDLAARGWGLLSQRLLEQSGVANFQAETVSLSSTNVVSFQLEGENVGSLPARFSLQRLKLRVVVP